MIETGLSKNTQVIMKTSFVKVSNIVEYRDCKMLSNDAFIKELEQNISTGPDKIF